MNLATYLQDDSSSISIQDLDNKKFELKDVRGAINELSKKLASEKESLRVFVDTNSEKFTSFLDQMRGVQDVWMPLKAQIDFKTLYGDPIEEAIKLTERYSADDRKIEKYHGMMLDEKLMEKCIEFAELPDYEFVQINSSKDLADITPNIPNFTVIINKKTRLFYDWITNAVKYLPTCTKEEMISECIKVYLRHFRRIFAIQLRQLPNLAALYYLDNLFLTTVCNGDDLIGEFEEATDLLDSVLAENFDDFKENFQQFDFQGAIIEDAQKLSLLIERSLYRIQKIQKCLLPFFNDLNFVKGILIEYYRQLSAYLWSGILGASFIDESVISEFRENLISQISNSFKNVFEEEFEDVDDSLSKIRYTFTQVYPMKLIQLTNAFRRGDIQLDLDELTCIVKLIYQDSPIRQALLEEIESEKESNSE